MRTKSLLFALTATVWAVVAATAVFWLLQGTGSHHQVSVDLRHHDHIVPLASRATTEQAGAAELSAFFGSTLPSAGAPEAPQAPNRFKLLGVIAQGQGGAALLALDNQPAKPYQVGSRLDEVTVLQLVGPRHVMLVNTTAGAPAQRLELSSP